jgi:hypothetical protein
MFWQREVLRSGVGMTFNETYELDLPKSGILGSLALYLRSTQNGYPFLTAVKWRLIDYISKIELIGDGAEVIKSFDGRQALASAFYDQGGLECPSMWRHYSNTPHRQWVLINFGRFLMDELFGLDLSQWNQVTLKITNDATATEFTTDVHLDVIAYWIREAAMALGGYFREEEWKKWAPVADTWEYNDLPIALPIRRILLRNRPAVDTADAKNNSTMRALMDDIDFTFRTGQTRVYRGSLEQLGHLSVLELGRYAETRGAIDRTQGYGFECGVGYVLQNLGYGGADADGITTALSNMSMDVQESAQEMAYRSANGQLEWVARGHAYMHSIPILEAKKPDLSDLLDPEAMKVVKLDAHCASGTTVAGTHAAAESAIVLSRLVRR